MKREKKPGDRRGTHPNSIANLNPVKPGEIRNPEGRRRKPYSDWDEATCDAVIPELVRLKLNATLTAMLKLDTRKKNEDILRPGITWGEAISIRKHLRGLIECDVSILSHLRDGVQGTPTQRIEATGKDGEPLTPAVPPTFVYSFIDPPPKTEPPVAAPPPPESTEK